MADEEENEDNEEGGGKKGGSKMMIIIIVVVLLLVVGGAGAFFALSGSGGSSGDGEDDDDEHDEELEDEELGELPGAIFPLDVFIVNLGVKGSFLKASLQLEFIDPEPPPTIESNVPKVRDSVIRVLSSRKASDLLSVEGKDKLREELVIAVNDALGAEDVLQVYFTEFIIQ